jgi:hypothetical protein
VRYFLSFGRATVLGGTLLALAMSGCSGAQSNPSPAAQTEADADRALEKAQEANTVEAFEAVMKRFPDTDASGRARIGVARLSAELALVAVGRGDWEEARMLASRAIELGDPIIAQSAKGTLEQVDRADARDAAERVQGTLGKDASLQGCTKAVSIVGQTLGDSPSAQLARDLRKATLQSISGCMQSAIEAAKANDDYAPVRKALASEDAKRAYGEDTQFALLTSLNDAVVAAMAERTAKDMAAGRWKEAFATFDAWAVDGKAGPQQVEAAKQRARDAITTELLAKGKKSLGSRTAEPVLADVQRALELFKGMNVSPDLERMRDHLTAWLECSKLRCLSEAKPKPMFSFGATSLHPTTSSSAAATGKIPHGTKLWVLARSPSFSLVTAQQPDNASSWEDRFRASQGWIQTSVLKTEDTTTWLPVGPALVGERVWLPTGRNDDLYLLGVVTSVDGEDVTVEKISDGQPSKVKRNDLRSGVLSAGTQVLAFCRDTMNLTSARFESVVAGDARAPRGEITCLAEDGSEERKRQEQLGALRAKPAWLPARRP